MKDAVLCLRMSQYPAIMPPPLSLYNNNRGSLHFHVTTITERWMLHGHVISVLSLAVWWAKLEKTGKVSHKREWNAPMIYCIDVYGTSVLSYAPPNVHHFIYYNIRSSNSVTCKFTYAMLSLWTINKARTEAPEARRRARQSSLSIWASAQQWPRVRERISHRVGRRERGQPTSVHPAVSWAWHNINHCRSCSSHNAVHFLSNMTHM